MAAKRLRDDVAPLPAGVPDRRPKNPKAKCDVCTTVGPEATLQLCLRRTGRPPGKFLGNATDVCTLMRGLENAERESFYALHLDVRHRIVDIDKVAVGSQSGVEVHPREVFKSALLSGASSLIFVHNHPSGDNQPSRQDEDLTRRLKSIGELVGISVLDHIIVGHDPSGGYPSCSSMASRGLLGNEQTDKYIPLAERAPKKRSR